MIAPARQAALRVLQQVDRGATLADALARERDRLADVRDRGLVTELTTGTLRWLGRLDAQLSHLSSRPWADVDPTLRHVLRLAAYQLLFLDRIPARAIVDDAVEQTREEGGPKATGFVNGLLRTLARAHPQGSWSSPPTGDFSGASIEGAASMEGRDGDLDVMAAALSHPTWLLARWRQRYGDVAMQRWARFNNQPADLTLRPNRLRATRDDLVAALTAEGVVVEPTRYAVDGLRVLSGQPIGGPAARLGLFTVQDEASQLVGEFAAAFAGARMLDTCAAPGGKTLALAAAASASHASDHAAMVVAADRRPKRLRVLKDTLAQAGATTITRVIQIDLRQGLPFDAIFDLVLVDAPCSGLGTVRREPDIKWRRTEPELAQFAETQARMLDVAARAVALGGRLVYATCSSEPEENERVVAAFLDRQPAFGAERPERQRLPAGVAHVLDDEGHLRTYPHLHGLEAFFAAALRRRN
jgi:16S rRNA (cytosine967-C5)-methyltransferase